MNHLVRRFDPNIKARIDGTGYYVEGDLVPRIGNHLTPMYEIPAPSGSTFRLFLPQLPQIGVDASARNHFIPGIRAAIDQQPGGLEGAKFVPDKGDPTGIVEGLLTKPDAGDRILDILRLHEQYQRWRARRRSELPDAPETSGDRPVPASFEPAEDEAGIHGRPSAAPRAGKDDIGADPIAALRAASVAPPRLGYDSAAAFGRAFGFDPNRSDIAAGERAQVLQWIAETVAPAISYRALPDNLRDDVLAQALGDTPGVAARTLQLGLNRLAGAREFGDPDPTFSDGTQKHLKVDGFIGPKTSAAIENHTAQHGPEKLREVVALAGLERGLSKLQSGDARAEDAKDIFDTTIGRLFAKDENRRGRSVWPASMSAKWPEVAKLQSALNESDRIFGFGQEPLVADGDFGPKTADAIANAARAAGAERLTDHIGKRFGIGEPDLFADNRRGFDRALADEAAHASDTYPADSWFDAALR